MVIEVGIEMKLLRFLFVLPAAVLFAWLGYLILYYPNLWMDKYILSGIGEMPFLTKLHVETMGVAGSVAGFICGGTYTAPIYKHKSAILLSGLIILLNLWSLYLDLGNQDWWGVYAAILGISLSGYFIFLIYGSFSEIEDFFSNPPWNFFN
jgi:hypothetical protein